MGGGTWNRQGNDRQHFSSSQKSCKCMDKSLCTCNSCVDFDRNRTHVYFMRTSTQVYFETDRTGALLLCS